MKKMEKYIFFYSLDYILQTFIGDEFVWRIQGTVKAQLSMPDDKTANWAEFANSEKSFGELYEEYKNLVQFDRIDYVFIEADTI